MDGGLEQVLRLVAEGRLTAAEAGPILDALGAAPGGAGPGSAAEMGAETNPGPGSSSTARSGPRIARIEVRESGKRVVDLRIPVSLGRRALSRVPGLSDQHVQDVQDAFASGALGPILDIEDADGDGVRIVLE